MLLAAALLLLPMDGTTLDFEGYGASRADSWVFQLDSDPALEIITINGVTREIVIWDGATGLQDLALPVFGFDANQIGAALDDVDGDGGCDVMVAATQGDLGSGPGAANSRTWLILGAPGTCSVGGEHIISPAVADLLCRAAPNPSRNGASIRFQLSTAAPVTMSVFDVTGRRVRMLLNSARLPQGDQVVVWDGDDDRGHPVASGVYYCHLIAGEVADNKPIIVLRR